MTGTNEIDTEVAIRKWNHLWGVFQWRDTYRVVKFLRKDSAITAIKLSISTYQAKELIEKLDLQPVAGGFRSATTWKRQVDWDHLAEPRKA